MLHPLPLPLSSCLGCIPPLIGLPSLRFYAVGSSLFLLSVCFCLCSLFYRDDVLCWLLLARPFLYAFHAHLRFPVDLVWFRLSCDHGWIRSGSVNVRKQQTTTTTDTGGCPPYVTPRSLFSGVSGPQAAPFNIISLHPQLPPCLLGRLNSQQRQPLHLTVSVS